MSGFTRRFHSPHFWIALLAAALPAVAQPAVAQPPEAPTVDAGDREAIIEDIAAALDEVYVFPEVAAKMGQRLQQRRAEGAYDEISALPDFCDRLTEDLQEVSQDLHLNVDYAPPAAEGGEEPSEEEQRQRRLLRSQRNNHCFERVERLDGNVGYLKLNCFVDAEVGGATAIAALGFLAHVDALIIDLRENGGGSPSMIQLLTSHFLAEPTHLNSFYVRRTDETNQFWTQAWVPGPRLTEVPMYVLTSGRTFSAAEEFSYNLRNLERGTLVGETTGGGAHPVERHRVEGYPVVVWLPFGRAVNPITGTNWEGTGVEPHVQVPADDAFDAAYVQALEEVESATEDEAQRRELAWTREALQVQLSPVELSATELEAFVGTYGPRVITREGNVLHYSRDGRPARPMVPLGDDRFLVEGVGGFRLGFERDARGAVVRIVGHYVQGHQDGQDRDGG